MDLQQRTRKAGVQAGEPWLCAGNLLWDPNGISLGFAVFTQELESCILRPGSGCPLLQPTA